MEQSKQQPKDKKPIDKAAMEEAKKAHDIAKGNNKIIRK